MMIKKGCIVVLLFCMITTACEIFYIGGNVIDKITYVDNTHFNLYCKGSLSDIDIIHDLSVVVNDTEEYSITGFIYKLGIEQSHYYCTLNKKMTSGDIVLIRPQFWILSSQLSGSATLTVP